MSDGMLDGITVLDLASVGPAARASRWLADYGARGREGRPGARTSRACRSCRRSSRTARTAACGARSSTSRRPTGREAFLALADTADVVIESFRPGVVDRARHRLRGGVGPQPAHRLLLDHRLRPERPALAVGGARPQLPRASAATSTAPGRAADGGPPIPGATVADSAGGGMHAVMAILAALVRRATTGSRRLPRRVGGRRRARAHGAPGRRVPRDRRGARAAATALLTGPLRLLRQLPARATASGSPSPRSSRGSGPTSAPRSARAVDRAPDRRRRAGRDPRRPARRVPHAATATTGSPSSRAADTCVHRGAVVPEVVDDAQFAARGAFVEAKHPDHGTFRQVGPDRSPAPPPRRAGPYEVRDATVTDTDDAARAPPASPPTSAPRSATQE